MGLVLFCAYALIFAVVMYFYQLPLEAVGYATGLCAALGLIVCLAEGLRHRRKITDLKWQMEAIRNGAERLPKPEDEQERLYQKLLEISRDEWMTQVAQLMKEKRDVTDYFTLWTHQIKMPASR